MLAHHSARLPGGVGDVAEREARSLEPFYGLAGALDRLIPDVERPVQVHQQPLEMHVLMIAGREAICCSGRHRATPGIRSRRTVQLRRPVAMGDRSCTGTRPSRRFATSFFTKVATSRSLCK